MLASASSLSVLIEDEINAGTKPERIILGGFSQGGVMSLLTGLTGDRRVGGLVVLSSRVPLLSKFKAMAKAHAAQTPIFWGHGTDDQMVTYQRAVESVELLTNELGFVQTQDAVTGLEFHTYRGMTHSTCQNELDNLAAWLKRIIPGDSGSSN
ncbi:hypothetical protein HWV62_32377 [Athelia sp. TMB]|nr:hypothetical protein HWV62_32377 [Athelia sp. TMB]